MGQLVWRDQMAIGIKEIDDDHKNLVHHINRVETLLSGDPFDIGEMADCLLTLMRYTREHFEREERLMNRIIFPNYEAHCNNHADFAGELYDIAELFVNNPTRDVASSVYQLLATWVINHLVKADRDIVAHLNKRGGSGAPDWKPSFAKEKPASTAAEAGS